MNLDWGHGRAPLATSLAPDPVFPQLASFHAHGLPTADLQQALGSRRRVTSSELVNVWYIPGKSLQVVVRLSPPWAAAGETLLTVQFLPHGEAGTRRQLLDTAAGLGKHVVHLPAWDAVGWLFPADPGLASLPALVDTRRDWTRLGGPDSGPVTWNVLSYLPGERCTVRFTFPGSSNQPAIVGKLEPGGTAERVHDWLVRLWAAPGRRFQTPRPLGVEPDLGIRWVQLVDGLRLDRCWSDGNLAAPLILRVVEAAAGLHAVPLPDLPVRRPPDVLRRIERKVLPRIDAALPALGLASTALYEALAQRATALPDRPLRTIHGDLHAANVLLQGDEVTLVDLDSLTLGDPAYDLALFGSRLLLLALNRAERLAETAELVAGLPEVYAAAGGAPIPTVTFAWYMAALLVGRQIRTCIRHCAPNLGQLAPALLAIARETLDHGRFTAAVCR